MISESEEETKRIEMMLKQNSIFGSLLDVRSIKEAKDNIVLFKPNLVIIITESLDFDQTTFINELNPSQSPVIVISEKPDDAVSCYEIGYSIVDFILKSANTVERMNIGVIRALNRLVPITSNLVHDFVFLKMSRTYKKFLLEDIIFVEAYGIYSRVLTPKGKFTINEAITKLEERLMPLNFIRVHKSYLINIRQIVSFRSSHFEMTLGDVPIGGNYKLELDGLFSTLKYDFF